MNKVIKLHPDDDLLVALTDIANGETINYEGITVVAQQAVQAKHKIFQSSFEAGQQIRMYGVIIGTTSVAVKAGDWVNVNNVKHATAEYAWRNASYSWKAPDVSAFANRTFQGYHRSDGSVGTANYWLFIPLVFCENRNLDVIKHALHAALGYDNNYKYTKYAASLSEAVKNNSVLDDIPFTSTETWKAGKLFPNVDGIKFLNHDGGCGGIRQDAAVLSKLLAAYANHPNVGGITVFSLGCQNLQVEDFMKDLKNLNPNFDKPLYLFTQQQSRSEEQMIADAIKQTMEGLVLINKNHRAPATLDKLTIGVKCGGSDGFSGISANPAVGYCSDLLVALGGKVLLAEFPELCGVEQELVDRCVNEEVAEKFTRLMKAYEKQVVQAGSGFHMNPSPGNIRDGLITDAMKSAGAAKKGGTAPIVETLDYAEPAKKPGLNLVCTPGNDVEATTGKAASGATLILFTTGLGTPTGNPVCPTIKLSSNTSLYKRMADIIDIDCGPVIEGACSIPEMGAQILEYCIKAASGEVVPKSVQLMQDDFIPWKRGVSL